MSVYQFSIDVPVENRWDNVERVRVAVQSCFEAIFRDVAGRDAIAMVTGELVENAIKYGDWTSGRGLFRLRVWGDQEAASVAVTNAIEPKSGSAERVRETIAFIAAQPSPLHAYQARMVAVAGGGSVGGLGLVRVPEIELESLRGDADGPVVMYGWHTVTAALQNPARRVQKLLATENAARRLAEEDIKSTISPEIVRPSAIAGRMSRANPRV